MPTSTGVLPFTEIFERVKIEELRDKTLDASAEDKYKATVNDNYRLWLPLEFDFKAYKKTATITTTEDYITGTLDVTSGGTALTGNSTVWTSGMTDRKVYINAGDEVYDFTYVSGTSGTIDRAYIGTTVSAGGYSIYVKRYSLASDFWRPYNRGSQDGRPLGSFYYYRNGVRVDLAPIITEHWGNKDFHNVAEPAYYSIVDVNGTMYVELSPPDTSSRTLYYDYVPYLSPMTEYTTGTVAVTNGSATVTGTSTDFSNATALDWFRVDDDGVGSSSVWYQILTVDNATQITLTSTYAGTTNTGKSYTTSMAPKLPQSVQPLLVYKSVIDRAIDRDAKLLQGMTALMVQFLGRIKQRDDETNENQFESIFKKYNYRG